MCHISVHCDVWNLTPCLKCDALDCKMECTPKSPVSMTHAGLPMPDSDCRLLERITLLEIDHNSWNGSHFSSPSSRLRLTCMSVPESFSESFSRPVSPSTSTSWNGWKAFLLVEIKLASCCRIAEKLLLQKKSLLFVIDGHALLLLLITMGIGDPWAEGLNMGLDHSWGSGMSSLVAFWADSAPLGMTFLIPTRGLNPYPGPSAHGSPIYTPWWKGWIFSHTLNWPFCDCDFADAL